MLLAQAGSGVATLGLPDSPGIPAGAVADTLVVSYNDLNQVDETFRRHPGEIAAVIVEPIGANMGFVMPGDGYLAGLQRLCREHGALFILDEVMTGFRVAPGGAQAAWELDPDLTCLGKVIGGGLPVGAYAGKREIMSSVAPMGDVYQAGTLAGNPLAMTAGLVTVRELRMPGVFAGAAARRAELVRGLERVAERCGLAVQAAGAPAEPAPITDYASARAHADTARYGRYFHAMLERGVYLAPSQFEAGFVSTAHSDADVQTTLEAAVPVRFPDLRIVFPEGGISWVPFTMWRLDKEFHEYRLQAPLLEHPPSHYIRQFYFATQPIEEPERPQDLVTMLDLFDGADRVLFASDWPHHDFDHPRQVLNMPFPADVKRKIMGANALALFGIEAPVRAA